MTRNDARMIAEELFKLQCKIKIEPLIGTDEAITFTEIPKGTFNKVINEIPHMKMGKRNYFRKSELSEWMKR
jgi:hypothetical protein